MLVILAAGALLSAVAMLAVWAAGGGRRPSSYAPLRDMRAPSPVDAAAEAKIRAFCGDCHALPRPESYDRGVWHDRVEEGYKQYGQSGRNDLDPPPMGEVVAYYRARAPERIPLPQPAEVDARFRDLFRREDLRADPLVRTPPAIAGLAWVALGPGEPPVLLASDMMSGRVLAADLNGPARPPRIVAQLDNPCHIEPCDLDGDGALDLLAADLGSFGAHDHDRGRVVWLRGDPSAGEFRPVVIASRLGRVADARPIDADARGGLDVIVAEFGWQRGLPTHFAVRPPADRAERAVLLAPDIVPSFSAAQFVARGAELDEAGARHEGLLALVELENGGAEPTYVAGSANFYVVTRYNWSSYYAMAVIALGEAVRQQL